MREYDLGFSERENVTLAVELNPETDCNGTTTVSCTFSISLKKKKKKKKGKLSALR